MSKVEREEFLNSKKSLISFEKDVDAARGYISDLSKSYIRDTGYLLLFPYVISCPLASLILKIRQDTAFDSDMMCDEFERDRDVYYVINKNTIERIKEFEEVYKAYNDEENDT